jgi:hypothetical protein
MYTSQNLFVKNTTCSTEILNKNVLSVNSNQKLKSFNGVLVTATFKQFVPNDPCDIDYNSTNAVYECVTWDDSEGIWNTDGCVYQRNYSIHICRCTVLKEISLRMVN